MKKGNLSIGWVRWRQRRYQALLAQGFETELAWPVAKAETRGRHRISRIVGNRAARDADLQFVEDEGKVRFVLVGDIAGLTDEQRAALRNLNSSQAGAA